MQQPTAEQENFAPVAPMEALRKPQSMRPVSLLEAAREWRAEMRKEKESAEWQARILASQKNELYYKGYQRLRKADFSNTYRPETSKPIHYTLNEFAFWVNVNVSKWIASRTDYRVHGIEDTPEMENAAQRLLRIGRYYDDRDWTRTETVKAAKSCQFEGCLVAYIYHDPKYDNRKGWRPVLERKPIKLGKDAYRCLNCGMTGEVEGDTPVCAHCESSNVSVIAVPEVEMEQEVDKEEVSTGDVTHEMIPLYNLCWKSRVGFHRSDLTLWEAEYTRKELEASYTGIEIPSTRNTDRGLQAQDALQNAGQHGTHEKTRFVLSRMWVEPTRYATDKLKETVKHRAGEIPADTPYIKAFPEGMHVIMLGDTIVDVYPAKKCDDLAYMEYQGTPHGLPHGIDDMCEPQRLMNTGTSLMYTWLRHAAAPPLSYVNGVVDPGDLSGDLTKPIPIDATQIGLYDGVTVDNAIMYRSGQQLPPQIFAIQDRWRAAIQFAAAAVEFNSGLPNVNNETATGARQTQSLSQSISSLPLVQWADFRAEIIKKKLKKFKQWCWDSRRLQFAGDYGVVEDETLSAADIPDDFQFETVPNSWLPRTPEQKQQNFQALLAAVGGPAGLAATPPTILAELCETYDVRLSDNLYPAAIRTVRMRIKQAKANIPALQQGLQIANALQLPPPTGVQPDPMTGMPVEQVQSPGQILFEMLTPKFSPREEGHAIAAEYLSRWLTTDDGLQAPPELIDFIAVLQDAHILAEMGQQQVRAGVQMAGAAPMGAVPQSAPPGANPAAGNMPVGG